MDIVTMGGKKNSYALYQMALFLVTLSDPELLHSPTVYISYRLSYRRSGWG